MEICCLFIRVIYLQFKILILLHMIPDIFMMKPQYQFILSGVKPKFKLFHYIIYPA